jgi:hypothetical protein
MFFERMLLLKIYVIIDFKVLNNTLILKSSKYPFGQMKWQSTDINTELQ